MIYGKILSTVRGRTKINQRPLIGCLVSVQSWRHLFSASGKANNQLALFLPRFDSVSSSSSSSGTFRCLLIFYTSELQFHTDSAITNDIYMCSIHRSFHNEIKVNWRAGYLKSYMHYCCNDLLINQLIIILYSSYVRTLVLAHNRKAQRQLTRVICLN